MVKSHLTGNRPACALHARRQVQDQVDHQIIGQMKSTEETLNPAIVGLLLGFAVENVGQFAEVHCCQFDEG